MTVGELIEELKEYPSDMPITVYGNAYGNKDTDIEISVRTWMDYNYPSKYEDYDYINLE